MDQKIKNAVAKIVEGVVNYNAWKAAIYLSDTLVVRVSQKIYRGRLPAKNQSVELILVIGRPNYEQREFIKQCKKAGEPFPVKRIQFKLPPKIKKGK